jgi:hypothetical protein
MDTTTTLAIVRNRLQAGQYNDNDRRLLVEIRDFAEPVADADEYARILIWAISNALADSEQGLFLDAALALDLVHNIRDQTGHWGPTDEAYFLKGSVVTYLERASLERIKSLFSLFGRHSRTVPSDGST